MIARVAYGAVFVVLLPIALAAWAARLSRVVPMPIPAATWAGWLLIAGGAGLMLAGTSALWVHGRGLPMSAFPPQRLVTRGAYRLFANPLYVGAVLTSAGVSLIMQSPAGLWLVSPTLAALATAWVMGFEASHTRALFGEVPRPDLHLPDAVDRAPTNWERAAVVVRVLVPWLIGFQTIEYLGAPSDAIEVPRLPGESTWPVVPFTEAFYLLAYAFVVAALFVAPRARTLRRFAIDGLIASAFILPFYLLVPLVSSAKAAPSDSVWTPLLRWERAGDAPVTALPAFHVVWSLIAADVLIARWPRLRAVILVGVAAIAISCITTGMHAVLDVVAAFIAYGLVRRASAIWRLLCRWAERVANSWRERRIGPLRLLSHGFWAAAGALGGVALATGLSGEHLLLWIVATTLVAILGAAVWAQVVEGSSALLRPYGFFGAVLGVLLGCVVAELRGEDGWLLLAAMSVGGCLTVALGRMRCLVQGCCHGHATDGGWGICYTHPRSRVVRLSALGGVPVHPTPLYSALWSVMSGVVVVRLWFLAAPLTFIAGISLMLAGLGRFVEEHYRGEPQTAQLAGLRLYQCLAIAMVALGAIITTVSADPAPAPIMPPMFALPVWMLLFAISYAAYGVDLPNSQSRFSRLV